MAERYSTEAQRRDIKLRTRDLVRANGGLEAAAEHTRLERAALGNHQSPDRPGVYMPADVVLDLELRAAEPLITRALAQHQGYTLVAAEPLDGADVSSVVRQAVAGERARGWTGDGRRDRDSARGLGCQPARRTPVQRPVATVAGRAENEWGIGCTGIAIFLRIGRGPIRGSTIWRPSAHRRAGGGGGLWTHGPVARAAVCCWCSPCAF